MSEAAPYNYQSALGDAMRRAADEVDPTERARLFKLFASYLETELDRAAGRTQTALWGAEERLRDQIGDVRAMINELGGFLREQRAEQQTQHAQLLAGQEGLRIEVAQQLTALGVQIDRQQAAIDSLQATVDEHDRLIGRLAERIARLEQRKHTSNEP